MTPRQWVAATVAAGGLAVATFAVWTSSSPSREMAAAPVSLPATSRAAARIVGRVELQAGAPMPAAPLEVMVFAYALDGPRLPLAVLRRPASDLPFDFSLDDSLAPNPAFRLSQATQLVVGARLGPAEALETQPRDWIAPALTVPLGTHGVRLVLQPPRAAR